MYNIYETYQIFFLFECLGLIPWVDIGVGGRQFFKTFSEYGHVAYQIKGTYACSNMVAYVLPVYTPSTLGMGPKGKNIYFHFECNRVAYQIKGKEHRAPCKHILCPYTHPWFHQLV